jgi:hypothetical protein
LHTLGVWTVVWDGAVYDAMVLELSLHLCSVLLSQVVVDSAHLPNVVIVITQQIDSSLFVKTPTLFDPRGMSAKKGNIN